MRATFTSSPGARSVPRWMTFVQKSCAKDVEAEMVSPATTARMVANAMAATKPKKTSPPRCCARMGALMFVPPFFAITSRPTMVAAPKPRKVVRM